MAKKNNNYRNKYQDDRLDKIEKHFKTMNEEFGIVKTDVSWLKRFFWIIATTSIGGLIAGILNLILK